MDSPDEMGDLFVGRLREYNDRSVYQAEQNMGHQPLPALRTMPWLKSHNTLAQLVSNPSWSITADFEESSLFDYFIKSDASPSSILEYDSGDPGTQCYETRPVADPMLGRRPASCGTSFNNSNSMDMTEITDKRISEDVTDVLDSKTRTHKQGEEYATVASAKRRFGQKGSSIRSARKKRARISDQSRSSLEDHFRRDPYPTPDTIVWLSQLLNLSTETIKNWFSNVRCRKVSLRSK